MAKQTCRKKKHPTRGAAKHEAEKLRNIYGVPYSFYKCKICGKYHTGRVMKGQVEDLKKQYLDKNAAVLGIDPGKKGALALICAGKVEVYDFVDTESAAKTIRLLNDKFQIKFAILEKVWFQPNERDIKSAEVLIRNAQTWETLLVINHIPYWKYSPITWRKNLVPKKLQNKPGYIIKAHELYPKCTYVINRHDRAEAVLMAHRALLHVESGMAVRLK